MIQKYALAKIDHRNGISFCELFEIVETLMNGKRFISFPNSFKTQEEAIAVLSRSDIAFRGEYNSRIEAHGVKGGEDLNIIILPIYKATNSLIGIDNIRPFRSNNHTMTNGRKLKRVAVDVST